MTVALSDRPTLTRRHVLLGLGAVAVAAPSALGCRRPRRATPPLPRTTSYDGVAAIELFPQGADEASPLLVAVHGMGDRPDRWVDAWQRFPARAQIVLPRAFERSGDGYSWFDVKEGMTDEQLGAAVGAAEARLWRAIATLAGQRRPVVTGFSQGGILSFVMAARHPDAVLRALPVAGSCPGPLLPRDRSRAAPLQAFHGTADRVLDVKWAREAVAAFAREGNEASLREYAGVGHTITPQMRADLWAAIAMALAA